MTESSEPIRLSICVPTYQRAAQLDSMLSKLFEEVGRNARHQEIEICISDNCSMDKTPAVIAERISNAGNVRIRHQRQDRNLGFSGNFAAVAHLAAGSSFVILADDDTLETGAIDQLMNAADRLSPEMPLAVLNTLPGGDAKDRAMRLPIQEMVLAGSDEILNKLGIFHTSFVSNMLFHRETAMQAWRAEMTDTRYPHAALVAVIMANRPTLYLPIALTKVHLPPDAWDQPMLTSVDMARLQTTFVLANDRCRHYVGWVYRYLVRMLPTAIYLHRIGKCPSNPANPYADLRLKNVRDCYRLSSFWQTVAALLWCIATYLPVKWLGGLLRLWSRHPR